MLLSTSYLQIAHRTKCWAPRGMDQRNHPGTGWDVRCVRSKRYLAERLLLSPSDLPERQSAILCSSQRDQHGWRQRVPIFSERKGEIAAKSYSYAHNRRMSHHERIFSVLEDQSLKTLNPLCRHDITRSDRQIGNFLFLHVNSCKCSLHIVCI